MNKQDLELHDKNEALNKAILFAVKAHRFQVRKGSDIPYIFHPINVGRILLENDCNVPVVIAGVLHDVVEDTQTKPDKIKQLFGDEVYSLVMAVTEKNKKDSWIKRKTEYIDNAKVIPLEALQIMSADKYDNLSQIKRDLDRFGDQVWERFNGSKDQIKWYYSELLNIFTERFTRLQDNELTAQLKTIKEEVFNG